MTARRRESSRSNSSTRSSISHESGDSKSDESELHFTISKEVEHEEETSKSHNDNIYSSPTNNSDYSILKSNSNTKTQAAFVNKVYKMLEDPEIHGLIAWSSSGDLFSVSNPTIFSKTVLPQYFKHNNWQSFVRQLNMYGFHKVNDMIHSNLTNETQTWEFRHPHFRRGAVDDLQNIKRKSAKISTIAPVQSLRASDSAELEENLYIPLQRHLNTVEKQLLNVTTACGLLTTEVSSLRTILLKQQKVMQDMLQVFTLSQNDHEWTKRKKTFKNDKVLTQQVIQLKEYTRESEHPNKSTEELNYFPSDSPLSNTWSSFEDRRYNTVNSNQITSSSYMSSSSSMFSKSTVTRQLPSINEWKLLSNNPIENETFMQPISPIATFSAHKKSRKSNYDEQTHSIHFSGSVSSNNSQSKMKEYSSHLSEQYTGRSLMRLVKTAHILNPEPSEDSYTAYNRQKSLKRSKDDTIESYNTLYK